MKEPVPPKGIFGPRAPAQAKGGAQPRTQGGGQPKTQGQQPPQRGPRPGENGEMQRRPAAAGKAGGKAAVQQNRPNPGVDVSNLLDLHLRSMLDDEIIRIRKQDYEIIVVTFMLGGEDIVFRAKFENHERNFILRGASNAMIDAKAAEKDRKIPMYNVYPAAALQQDIVAKRERRQAERAAAEATEATQAEQPRSQET